MESMRRKTAGHDLYFFYGHPRRKKIWKTVCHGLERGGAKTSDDVMEFRRR
jgi:hypothetical protein